MIYGHGTEPVHVSLPGHQVSLIIRRANALLGLGVEGTSQLALVKGVPRRTPVLQIIEHIDLLVVKKGEKVIIEVPLVVTGEPFGSNIVTVEVATIKVEAEATHIPQSIEVTVEGKEERHAHHRGRRRSAEGRLAGRRRRRAAHRRRRSCRGRASRRG